MFRAWSEFLQCVAASGVVCGMVYLHGWLTKKGMDREMFWGYHRGSCCRVLSGTDCGDGCVNGRVVEQEWPREY